MAETSKARERREREGFYSRYIRGKGLDIGCGNDPLTTDCDVAEKPENGWSFPNGTPPTDGRTVYRCDAHTLEGVPSGYDWVYASHVLEHMENPVQAVCAWFEHVKVGGYLIVAVPHRDLYEKRKTLPSRWNEDHKSFWVAGWNEPPVTLGLLEFLTGYLPDSCFEIPLLQTCDEGHTETDPMKHSNGEYQIEAVVLKTA